LFEAVLADELRVLGPDHPVTLTSRDNLASAYLSAAHLEQAIALSESTLADRQRVLGPDHPDTLESCNNLGFTYSAAGQLDRAIPLWEATLADCERVLGPDHPTTRAVRGNLSRRPGSTAVDTAKPIDAGAHLAPATINSCSSAALTDHGRPSARACHRWTGRLGSPHDR
jgi:hypothetical protein